MRKASRAETRKVARVKGMVPLGQNALAKVIRGESTLEEYNQVRPHTALNYRPPAPETTIPLTLT